jgi:hypothetical protein
MTQRHGLPVSVFTSDPDAPNSTARVETDQARTSFFRGREFRSFSEVLALTGTTVFQFVTPVNTILRELTFELEDGSIRIETVTGGTPGGSFSTPAAVALANSMTDVTPYTRLAALNSGGTHTGGLVLDMFRIKTANNTNRSTTVGAGFSDERGVPPGTYYFRVTGTAATGVLRARWEER